MGNLFHGPTPFILLFVVLLLFGAPKLPGLAKSLGQSMKILKKEVSNDADHESGAGKDAEPKAAAAAAGDDELANAKAEAAAAKAEAEALRAAAEKRTPEEG